MSFLARLANRATLRSGPAVLVPKQRAVSAPVFRAEAETEPEEITEAPVGEGTQRSSVATLSRSAAEPEEEAQLARAVDQSDQPEAQRMDDEAPTEEVQPWRLARQSEEPEGQAPAEDEDELMASRAARQTGEVSEEEEETLQASRAPTAEEMSPENATLPEETAGDPEPPDLRALRHSPTAAAAPGVGAVPDITPGALAEASESAADGAMPPATGESAATPSAWEPPMPFFEPRGIAAGPAEQPSGSRQPRIQIDQLDVLIHEPSPATSPSPSSGALTRRAVRARYLRRL